MSKNDERIIQLKKQIEDKKKKLNKVSKFVPITNCSIELDGIRYNLQVLQKQELIHILVKLTAYEIAASKLELYDEYIISGYLVEDWITDILSKLDVINFREEETKLKAMESKLSRILSEEKKTELELDEIENLLK